MFYPDDPTLLFPVGGYRVCSLISRMTWSELSSKLRSGAFIVTTNDMDFMTQLTSVLSYLAPINAVFYILLLLSIKSRSHRSHVLSGQ